MDRLTVGEILEDISAYWPEVDTPSSRVVLSIIRLNDLLAESYGRVLETFGLSQAGFEVLVTLRTRPQPRRMTPTELYRSILISSGGMTKVLKGLEAAGYIAREDNPDDRRSRFVALTEAGADCAEAAMSEVSVTEQELLDQALNEQQIRQLGKVLLRTLNRLERD